MSKIILKVDASAIKESSCIRRFYWTVVSGYREKLNTNDIEYGSAFHEFVKVMKNNPGRYDMGLAAATTRYSVPMVQKAQKMYMNMVHLHATCLNFWEKYQAVDLFETVIHEGKPLVELGFNYPYYSDDKVEVQLCGTIDDICKHKHGTYALRDYKTTSVGKADDYLSAYALSPQLMFYRMLVDYYARAYPESIFATINAKGVSCFIDGVFLRGAAKPAEFIRSEVFTFPRDQMAEFEQLVNKRIMDLVEYVKSLGDQQFPPREGMINGACQTVYGKCKFFSPCLQIDNISTQHLLNRYFIQRQYDPLAFGKEHEKTNG